MRHSLNRQYVLALEMPTLGASMAISRKLTGRVGIPVSCALASGFTFAPAAVAHPHIDFAACETGNRQYYCSTSYSGTSGNVTTRWDIYKRTQYVTSFYDEAMPSCSAGVYYVAKLYVTDSVGTSSTRRRIDRPLARVYRPMTGNTVRCYLGSPAVGDYRSGRTACVRSGEFRLRAVPFPPSGSGSRTRSS